MKMIHRVRYLSSLLTFLMLFLSACLSSNSPTEAYIDQVEAGVAATLTKEAFVRSIDTARQTEAIKNLPTETITPIPTLSPTIAPSLTHTPELVHVLIPGDPISLHTYISDIVTVDLAKDKTAVGDNYAWSRLERPYTPERMEYRGYLDIYQVNLKVTDPWIYNTFVLIGKLPLEGDIRYSIELDVDHNGRGDFLVMAILPPDSEWTTDNVWVMADADDDIGGLYPLYMEDPLPNQTGYEIEIFNNGVGEDRDLAWVRRDPDYDNQIQIAFKDSLIGTLGFLWSAWADEGLRDPALYDFNDHFTFVDAGSPNKENYRYPLKAVALIDSTCRSWYGYVPSGEEPGLCFTDEQVYARSGYGWCIPSATEISCGSNPCLTYCPSERFCIPCK
ncbi:MAG: hypothetical protein MUO54_16225 [Anaerolineales bacterium]|nr:hypothetical protein [Anaerolineales bacterium]